MERVGAWIIVHENKSEGAVRPNHLVDGWSSDVYVAVQGIDAIYDELSGNSAIVIKETIIEQSGMKEFTIKDLDGYWITFGEYVGNNS